MTEPPEDDGIMFAQPSEADIKKAADYLGIDPSEIHTPGELDETWEEFDREKNADE